MTTAEKKAEFVIKRAEGQSVRKICRELAISRQTGARWGSELAERIREEQEARVEDLIARYRITRAARLARLGDLLERVNAEISGRDFSDIPTDKLIKAALDLEERLERLEGSEIPGDIREAGDALEASVETYRRIIRGEITPARARVELAAIDTMGRAILADKNAW